MGGEISRSPKALVTREKKNRTARRQ